MNQDYFVKSKELKEKVRVIRMFLGEKCLFCEKNALGVETLKQRSLYISEGRGSKEEYDENSGIKNEILLCDKCQERYELLREIEEEKSKIKYCLND